MNSMVSIEDPQNVYYPEQFLDKYKNDSNN